MIDDSLSDTQPIKSVGTKEQLQADTNQLGKFNTKLSSYKLIWNEAIEAAAKGWIDSQKYYGFDIQKQIRKLKK